MCNKIVVKNGSTCQIFIFCISLPLCLLSALVTLVISVPTAWDNSIKASPKRSNENGRNHVTIKENIINGAYKSLLKNLQTSWERFIEVLQHTWEANSEKHYFCIHFNPGIAWYMWLTLLSKIICSTLIFFHKLHSHFIFVSGTGDFFPIIRHMGIVECIPDQNTPTTLMNTNISVLLLGGTDI